ncbi:PIR Superfamily Protein [Plasmodium ovale wallikeri]|uniref:PIR Superfamily Protein n=1 Tax=Plasmodium ovale wallikeri TaxID=864142 RepID=A0A1A9ASN9_PLAOA|nr:PIR Superfamily Protein [Plasmodium ovale wallikeri]
MGTDNYDTLSLTSNRCYTTLDTRYITEGNDEKCKKLETDNGQYTNAALLCMGLKGNLKNYDALDFFEKMKDYKCKYLSLWVHDRLSKLKGVDETTMKSTLFGIWGESKNFEKCSSSDFGSYLNSADYIKEKNLYDYALNYEDLENRYRKTDIIPCTTKIAEYIRKSKELYNKIKSECEPSKNTKIQRSCNALKDIQTIYPNDELLKLECKRIEDNLSPLRGQGDGRHGSQEDFRETSASGLPAQEVAYSDTQKAIGTVVPILGVLSIGFILHKFTGLGSMARNLLRGRINGMNSHDELPNELLESTYDDQVHPDITETYIGYQAT